MSRKITKAQMEGILVNLFFVMMAYAITNFSNENWLSVSAILYVFSLIFNLYLIRKINNKKIGYFFMIYIIMWTLYLSQIFLPLIKDTSYQNIFLYFSMNYSIRAFTYSYICIHLMTISYYLFVIVSVKNPSKKKSIVSNDEKKLVSVLFYIFYFLKILIIIKVLLTSKENGYLDALKEITSIRSTIVSFADIFAIIYLNFNINNRKKRELLIFIIIIEIISMLSGSRMYSVVYLLLLFITVDFVTEDNKVKKKRLSKKIALLIGVVILLGLSTGIRYAREGGGDISYENIMEAIKNHGIVVETIKEFGSTQIDTIISIENEGKYNFAYGKTYLISLLTLLPNINGFYDGVMEELYFTNILSKFFTLTYGGSNIAESFINFRYFGALIFLIFGFVLSKIDKFIINLKNKSITYNIFVLMLAYQIMLWTRSYFSTILRNPIWLIFFYVVLKIIFVKKRRNE